MHKMVIRDPFSHHAVFSIGFRPALHLSRWLTITDYISFQDGGTPNYDAMGNVTALIKIDRDDNHIRMIPVTRSCQPGSNKPFLTAPAWRITANT